jgi:hypothetical protein
VQDSCTASQRSNLEAQEAQPKALVNVKAGQSVAPPASYTELTFRFVSTVLPSTLIAATLLSTMATAWPDSAPELACRRANVGIIDAGPQTHIRLSALNRPWTTPLIQPRAPMSRP